MSDQMHTWPDGQVRPEMPYRCGCFVAETGEQCTKLSDHDGPHTFAPDAPTPQPDAGAGDPRPRLISQRLRDEIARVDSACRMRPLGIPDATGPLPTIYEILRQTGDESDELAESMRAAMESFVILSQHRGLLAITLARALPEIERLLARAESAERQTADLREKAQAVLDLDQFHEYYCATRGDIPFPCDCNAPAALAALQALITSPRPNP